MYYSIEIQEIEKFIEKYNETSVWDVVYNISTVLMLLVSTISLIISIKVYTQTARMHNQSILLTKKIHADSLTPYIVIQKINSAATLVIDGYPELKVDKIDVGYSVIINDKVTVQTNQMRAKICTEFDLYNMLDIPAEITLNTYIQNIKQNEILYLVGKEKKTLRINYEMNADLKFMLELKKGKGTSRFNIEYKGPGMSAKDIINGTFELSYSPDLNLRFSRVKIENRNRVYEEVDK